MAWKTSGFRVRDLIQVCYQGQLDGMEGETQIGSGCEMPGSEFWPNQLLLDHIKLNRLQLRTQTGQAAMN